MGQDDDIDLDALAEAYNGGLAAERAGETDRAAALFARALALDPSDRCGAAVRLAAMGRGEPPPRAPEAYVTTLFDQHASRFDDMLVDDLGYSVPVQIREMFEAHGVEPVARLLDLGCGTGLSGQTLGDWAAHLTGVDLSEAMLDEADAKGVYDEMYVAEAVTFLEAVELRWQIVVATDMVPYLGALEALFAGAARRLEPRGWFAFSTEALGEGGPDWAVLPTHRYGHAPGYLMAALAEAGFEVLAMEPIVVRYDEGRPQPGHLVLARLAGA